MKEKETNLLAEERTLLHEQLKLLAEQSKGCGPMELAQEFCKSMDGPAEIQQYNEERHDYEAIVYPEFEY